MRRFLLCALLAAGCDSKAASDPQPGIKPEQRSKELESCAASVECAEPLRCFDQTCRRVARSTVGDYYAALGTAARDQEAAISAFSQALGHYEAEKVPLPPEIDCAYGTALVAAKAKKEHAELGARVMHRCLLATPVGSKLHAQAIAQLATLADVGLDPLTLAKPQLADLYLTKGPAKPATDKLTVTIAGLPQKSNDAVMAKLNETDTHSALITCWQNFFDSSHKDTLAVTIPAKAVFIASEYEDEQGVWVVKLEPATAAGAEAAADSCIRQVLEPVLKTTAKEGYNAKLAITIK